MRRVVFSVRAAVIAVGGCVAACGLAVAAGPVTAAPVPGKAVCTISDDRLTEISGMVASSGGYVVVNDGSDQESHRKIFFLNDRCKLTGTVSYPSLPRDPEDLAVARDGTLWVADIGDNVDSAQRRPNIALWRLPEGGREPSIYRMKYPDGPHDAEALLLAGDGTPVIVTKDLGTAGVYTPVAALTRGQTVDLRRVGEFSPPRTNTSNPLAIAGRLTVTGGASAPDGSRVVLRTYADAFEFDVTGGDVVKAITKGTPRITQLPDEPRGESITYSTDGSSFLTVSETAAEPAGSKPEILRYAQADGTAAQFTTPDAAGPGSAGRSWFDQLTLTDITYLVGGVGVLGLVLVAVGVLAILRARRRSPEGGTVSPQRTGGSAKAGRVPARGQGPARGRDPADERPTARISQVPAGPEHHPDDAGWDRPEPAAPYGVPASSAVLPAQQAGRGREYRSGTAGGDYRSGGAPRRAGGEYRSGTGRPAPGRSGTGRADRGGGGYGDQPPGTATGGGYGRPAPGTDTHRHDASYGYVDPEPHARY